MSSDSAANANRPGDPPPDRGFGAVLRGWLAMNPEAIVGAVDGRGGPAAFPADIALGPGHQVDDRSTLELVVPDDTKTVTDTFVAALTRGVAMARVRMASDPDHAMLIHYVDVREEHGVLVRVVVPSTEDGEEPARPVQVDDLSPSTPRLGVLTKNEVAEITGVDEATTALLGWTAEEMCGFSTLRFIHPDDHVRAIDNWTRRLSNPGHHTQQTVRLRYMRRDGTWMWLDTSNDFQEQPDGTTRVVCQVIDVSDEMAAVEALRHNEQFLRRLTDTVPVGLFHIAADGRVVFANAALQSHLGTAAGGTQTDLARAVLRDDWPLLDSAIGAVMADGGATDLDVVVPRGDGRTSQCRITLRAVLDDDDAVIGVLGCVVDVTELKVMADTDGLTGLHNRRAIVDILNGEIAASGGRLAAIFADLDGFKEVNDRYGHRVGDQLLAAVSERLRGALRPGDHIGRIGGDEFLIVCPGLNSNRAAMDVAQRLHDALVAEPFLLPSGPVCMRASMGVARARRDVGADELVAAADGAMYTAKQRGDGRPVVAPVAA